MTFPSISMQAAIAATRFGLGARPGEIEEIKRGPQEFLIAQIRLEGAEMPQDDGESSAMRFAQLRVERHLRTKKKQTDRETALQLENIDRANARSKLAEDFLARARLGTATAAGFRERWALFWANHFTVSSTKRAVTTLAGPFEREAIRPHVFGRFQDLLIASSTHPAMLTYLDQAPSVGPNSPFVSRQRQGRGLNENLAREILELHTVGVDAGYTQADVTEFARALTGFSVGGEDEERAGQFAFHSNAHEPGAQTIFGKTYADNGVEQGLAVLKTLASDPHTARHLSRKLARHFVSDTPPPTLAARLEKRWMDTGGDLSAVARALIESPEAWDPTPEKFKTPYEFALSTWRAAGGQPPSIERLAPILTNQGQKPFAPPSPKGWPDDAQTWATPSALIKRMQWAQGMAITAGDRTDPNVLAIMALGDRLTPPVAEAISRAETRSEGFALLVMSPEFQRR